MGVWADEDPEELLTWGEGAEGTEGFPEEVRETELLLLLTLDTGMLLLLFILLWSMEFTMGLESAELFC